MFEYQHRVQFYETDLMGIVHHANYLRIVEEARVAWANARGVLQWDKPETASAFAVLGTEVSHVKPCRFGDLLRVEVQVKVQGVRVFFEYKVWKDDTLVAESRTKHVHLDGDMRPQRPSEKLVKIMEKEAWNETWLSSL